MKRWLCLGADLLVALSVLGVLGCTSGRAGEWTLEESRAVAEDYLESSPTFAFDGIEGSIVLVGNETMRCPYCWAFSFDFECSHAGYGDRTGQYLAQVITPHTAWIAVHRGEVVQAVMDGVWDMIEQQMLAGPGEQVTETFAVEVGGSFTLSLDSNPTTGYSWTAHFDGRLLQLTAHEFEPSSDLIGAGGVETFEFTAVQEGDTTIVMVYERTWEEGYLDKVVCGVHITGVGD